MIRTHLLFLLSLAAAPALGDNSLLAPGSPQRAPTKREPDFSAPACGIYSSNERPGRYTPAELDALQHRIDALPEGAPTKVALELQLAVRYQANSLDHEARARQLDLAIGARAAGHDVTTLAAQRNNEIQQGHDWRSAAIKEYLVIIGQSPPNTTLPQMDEVLFHLAVLLTGEHRDDQARPIFERLIKDHPTSHYLPDAYLGLGLYFFERRSMDEALKFFAKAEAYSASEASICAELYEAWTYFRRGDEKHGLTRAAELLGDTRISILSTAKEEPILDEARRSIAVFYASVGQADRAWSVFVALSDERAAIGMMHILEDEWRVAGRSTDADRAHAELARHEGK